MGLTYVMATRFVTVDRATPLLFPPDLRDWVREDDIVHLIVDAVEILPLQQFRVNRRGTGSAQYPPKMMLALLIYCYATGSFSSREIEALTYSQVSVRYLCANTHPDHDTICRFRRENKALLEETFVRVLELAAALNLSHVGTVAIDGSKIAANASKHQAVSYGRAGEKIIRLEEEVQALLAKAEGADSTPLQDGLSLPQEIARREARKAKLEQARAALIERTAAQRAQKQAEYEAKVAARKAKRERGEVVKGHIPQPPSPEPEAGTQYNFTDPQSRIMKSGSGAHFLQAYNAQIAVCAESLLIVGQRVSDAPTDKAQLEPTLKSIPRSLGVPASVLVDAGYYSGPAIERVEATARAEVEAGAISGIPAPATIVYAAVRRARHHQPLAEYEAHPEPEPPPADSPVQERMEYRLATAQGRALYKLRKQTVEPVFGIIKEVLGFRRFQLRGFEKVSLEWTLVSLAWNMKRLHKLGLQSKLADKA